MRAGLLALLLLGPAWAEEGDPPDEAEAEVEAARARAPDADLTGDPMWIAWEDEHCITARRLAEERLAVDSEDLVAHFVLGGCFYKAEGDLPRARLHLDRVVEIYERRYDNEPDSPWRTHARALTQLGWVASAMDDREAQLAYIEHHDRLYNPKQKAEQIWPLMKLGRSVEARELAAKVIEEGDEGDVSRALNSLCALNGELGLRQPYWDSCQENLAYSQSRDWDLSVVAHNHALAAWANLRFDELEEIARLGTNGDGSEVSNPWSQLAWIHLSLGRGAAAIDDVRNMRRWQLKQEPDLREQNRSELDATYAEVLLMGGYAETGMEIANRILRYPDREGFSSGEPEEALGDHTMLRIAMRQVQQERARERAAGRWFGARLWTWLQTLFPSAEEIADRATIRAILSDADRARGLYRVYLFDGLSGVPTWRLGDTIDVLGTGVARASLRAARQAEEDGRFEPWFQAIEAEIAWREGDEAETIELATSALDGLAQAEVLLAARVAAVGADAAWSEGEREQALAWYGQALRDDPGVLRRLGLELPARIEDEGGSSASVAAALSHSPRLRSSSTAFVLAVSPEGDGVRGCLLDPLGSRVRCASASRPPAAAEGEPDPLEGLSFAGWAADLLQRRLFALPLGLSQVDLQSLDGTTIVANEAVAERVDKILGGLDAP